MLVGRCGVVGCHASDGLVAAVVQLAGFAQGGEGFEQFGDAVLVGVGEAFGQLGLGGRGG